jgi:outer membrane murein-binding lipoprotein Lpp
MFWFDGVTLILIVIMVGAAFLLGLWEGHCDADESLDYLSAEVENLNSMVDTLLLELQNEREKNEPSFFSMFYELTDSRNQMEKFISDNEAGISPELQQKIRDAWRQANEGR